MLNFSGVTAKVFVSSHLWSQLTSQEQLLGGEPMSNWPGVILHEDRVAEWQLIGCFSNMISLFRKSWSRIASHLCRHLCAIYCSISSSDYIVWYIHSDTVAFGVGFHFAYITKTFQVWWLFGRNLLNIGPGDAGFVKFWRYKLPWDLPRFNVFPSRIKRDLSNGPLA